MSVLLGCLRLKASVRTVGCLRLKASVRTVGMFKVKGQCPYCWDV